VQVLQEPVDAAVGLLAGRPLVALTGAGLSTDSGIPDYRGPGAPRRTPMTYQEFVSGPVAQRRYWARSHVGWARMAHAEPNAGHRALVTLERAGRLAAILTQNIDGLHQRAGSDPDLVVEIHGTIFEVECLGCGARGPMREALDRVAAGEVDPPCRGCGGILKSATISFGQAMEERSLAAAYRAATDCDLLLAVGTSLTVYPAAGLVDVARRAGARVVIVNGSPTPYDEVADAVLREPIGQLLPELIEAT
jgi:NAD-dependent deacetylase